MKRLRVLIGCSPCSQVLAKGMSLCICKQVGRDTNHNKCKKTSIKPLTHHIKFVYCNHMAMHQKENPWGPQVDGSIVSFIKPVFWHGPVVSMVWYSYAFSIVLFLFFSVFTVFSMSFWQTKERRSSTRSCWRSRLLVKPFRKSSLSASAIVWRRKAKTFGVFRTILGVTCCFWWCLFFGCFGTRSLWLCVFGVWGAILGVTFLWFWPFLVLGVLVWLLFQKVYIVMSSLTKLSEQQQKLFVPSCKKWVVSSSSMFFFSFFFLFFCTLRKSAACRSEARLFFATFNASFPSSFVALVAWPICYKWYQCDKLINVNILMGVSIILTTSFNTSTPPSKVTFSLFFNGYKNPTSKHNGTLASTMASFSSLCASNRAEVLSSLASRSENAKSGDLKTCFCWFFKRITVVTETTIQQ